MQSCDEMQQEIAETGENRYCIEEEVDSELENEDESSNLSDSSSGSNSSNSSQSGCMEVEKSDEEEEEEQVPVVEMVLKPSLYLWIEIRYGSPRNGRSD